MHASESVGSFSENVPACLPVSPGVSLNRRPDVEQCPPASPDVPGRPVAFQKREKCGTNPISKPLTPFQLHAARCLAHGLTTDQAADDVGTTRRTINRWRKLPAFAMEIIRLHELILLEQVMPRAKPASRLEPVPDSDPDADLDSDLDEPYFPYSAESIRTGKSMAELVREQLDKPPR